MSQLFTELKRRNVLRVAVAYLAGSWLIIQVLETLFPIFGIPESSIQSVVIVLAVLFIPALVLSWIFELTPDGLKFDANVEHDGPAPYSKLLDRTTIVILVLAVGYFAIDKFIVDPARDAEKIATAREEGRADAIVDAYGDKSIIVLPFANFSDDKEQEYFSDGLTEELLNLLAKIPELRVISRTTAFTFKGSDLSVTEIARKAEVGHVLEGSVRRSGNTIRITAQLIDANSDTHLWSDTYDREFDNIFEIQDEISAHVVDELKVRMLGSALEAERADPVAYDLFLQARHILNSLDMERQQDAESLLLRALEIQPNYAAAISELARYYFVKRSDDPEEINEIRRKRDEQIARLIELNPEGAEANMWLATVNFWEGGDPHAAAKQLETAIRKNPTDSRILQIAVFFLGDLNRAEEASALGKYIVRRDPACSTCLAALAWSYRLTGRHAEAVKAFESILEWRSPDANFHWSFGVALLFAGEPHRALEWFDSDPESGMSVGYMAALYDAGRYEEFEERLARVDPENPVDWEGLARINAWIGNNEAAMDLIDRMVERDPSTATGFYTDFYKRLDGYPRWEAFKERHGYNERTAELVAFNPEFPDEITRALAD